ncbi:MAG TPA: hypothetical protein VKV39_12220 [Candidatus Sulfotelmatobacter sp.]|nr:hypothetical protein [Candidatus Sulfotelmatobacter sp.]
MKKALFLVLMVFAVASLAIAQNNGVGTIPNQDVLGAHLGYGRGCVMCHAPHSGPGGNGKVVTDSQSGEFALWGQDLTPLYGLTKVFSGDGKTTYSVTLPAQGTLTSAHDPNTVILFCLSCHDGAVAANAHMQNSTVETLPVVGGHAPTLLGADGSGATNPYQNDHPVGQFAIVSCNGGTYVYGWDCSGGGNTLNPIVMNGTGSTAFLTNYAGSFWNNPSNPLSTITSSANTVTCTTCHDQHSMTAYANAKGTFATSFFIRGNYVPQTGGNNAAQFCRNCHGGESNEMHGLLAVPTT